LFAYILIKPYWRMSHHEGGWDKVLSRVSKKARIKVATQQENWWDFLAKGIPPVDFVPVDARPGEGSYPIPLIDLTICR
jgi:hypothetical protein